MNVRQKLIELFENNRNETLSGEELAERLGCSRAAVWKAVKALRSEGYAIDAASGKGYCLAPETDVLSTAGVEKYLSGKGKEAVIDVRQSVDSTNNVLRDMARAGAPEGTAVISAMQTGGKGRLGRSFFSPSNTGLYLSLLLRPDTHAADSVRITTAAAVAVARAIFKCTGQSPQIKWVNDVYLRGLKVCGILTEAAFSLESGGLDYAVVGIGINVYEPEGGFSEELKGIAGAVLEERQEDLRNRLAAEVISELLNCCGDLFSEDMLNDYRSRLMWKGEAIRVISGRTEYPCTLLGVDDSYALLVRREDGSEQAVSSGEITIRRLDI